MSRLAPRTAATLRSIRRNARRFETAGRAGAASNAYALADRIERKARTRDQEAAR